MKFINLRPAICSEDMNYEWLLADPVTYEISDELYDLIKANSYERRLDEKILMIDPQSLFNISEEWYDDAAMTFLNYFNWPDPEDWMGYMELNEESEKYNTKINDNEDYFAWIYRVYNASKEFVNKYGTPKAVSLIENAEEFSVIIHADN